MTEPTRTLRARLAAVWSWLQAPGWIEAVAAVGALAVVLAWVDAPVVEDSLFWWVPKGLSAAEHGPQLTYAHDLPVVVSKGLEGGPMPPQWAAGLPDYAHPPLWYWWLGACFALFGPSIATVHLACAPVAVAAAVGWVALARRLGSPVAGLAPFALPPVLAQLLRPELDLPLLAAVAWALVGLVAGRWALFVGASILAVGCKEPGVLLAAAALLRVVHRGEWRRLPHALAPLCALAAWGMLHGGLASAERLPDSVWSWLLVDLPSALRLVCWEQGRGLLVVGLIGAGVGIRPRHREPFRWLLGFAVVWVVFFSIVGFRLQPQNPEPLTHVRYFVPGVALLALLSAQRWPWIPLAGLLFLHARSPYGPEASLYGVDAGRAEAASADWIRSEVALGRRVWVGSYHMAALSQDWTGHGSSGAAGVKQYSATTDPNELQPGDRVIFAAYGEPAGGLLRHWSFAGLQEWTAGAATVMAAEVIGPQQQ